VIVDAVAASGVPKDQVLLLPTGDGVGIVLVDVMRPYDVDVGIALDLLARIAALNAEQTDRQRRFLVRVAVNENSDNLVVVV
jgi:hypothetical protein